MHITARGGNYSEGPFAEKEMGDKYLRTIFEFMGITDFTTVAADKLDVIGEDVDAIVEVAIDEANSLAETF